ncbi:MAG: ABC transporter permease [Acidobacteria bacterium]|nr:ABC transporter permease [Acidobacteriota bacterium]
MSELTLRSPGPTLVDGDLPAPTPRGRRLAFGHRMALIWEVVTGGLVELWSHKLRSSLTLTLLTLGVFALVVMTSVLDGVVDKIATGFSGLSFDGTVKLIQKEPETTEEAKRFAMSPGLRYEDLGRLTAPHEQIRAFLPRAQKGSTVRLASGNERTWTMGVTPDYFPWMNRAIGMGRGLTPDDAKRRSPVAVVGASLASKLFGGADPVGRTITVDGQNFQIVGVLAPLQVMSEDTYLDGNGVLIPLEAYMDRMDAAHRLSGIYVKMRSKRDLDEVSAVMISRAKQAHHGIEDIEIEDLAAEILKAWKNFEDQMRGWAVVLYSLAGTVLLVGGVGVLSVMLISFSDRRFEIGLRKSLGATDQEILVQFLLEAVVLAALGALVGTVAGAMLCEALSSKFPYGLVVNPMGLLTAWAIALLLSLVFGLYPALRAARLSPMEAMR